MSVQYQHGVPASVRAYCDAHCEQINSVDFSDARGPRAESWRYMAWLNAGWNQGDDAVHSVIADSARELIARLRAIGPCECETCKPPPARPRKGERWSYNGRIVIIRRISRKYDVIDFLYVDGFKGSAELARFEKLGRPE